MAKFMPAARTRELREKGIETLPELRQAQFHASTVLHASNALAKLEEVPRSERDEEYAQKVSLIRTELKNSQGKLFDLLRTEETSPVTKKQIINYNAELQRRLDGVTVMTSHLSHEVFDPHKQHPFEVRRYALKQLASFKANDAKEESNRAVELGQAFFGTPHANSLKKYDANEKELSRIAVDRLFKGAQLGREPGVDYAEVLLKRVFESHEEGVNKDGRGEAEKAREDVTRQVTDFFEEADSKTTENFLSALKHSGEHLRLPDHPIRRGPLHDGVLPFVKALAVASKRHGLTEEFKRTVHEHVYGRGLLGKLSGMSDYPVSAMPETSDRGSSKSVEREKLWQHLMPKPKRNELEF